MADSAIIVIPWAQTDWQVQGRLTASTPLPINEAGRRALEEWAGQLAEAHMAVIYASAHQTARETASVLAAKLAVKVKLAAGLEEINLGLWEGLTPEQLRRRSPRVYRQWLEEPASVAPPEGEALAAAWARIAEALERITGKHRRQTVGLVLGRLAGGLATCLLEGRGWEAFWENVEKLCTFRRFELPEGGLPAWQEQAHFVSPGR